MMDALVDLPPMAFADLIGIHPKTAERWATLAGGNWSEYLAIRAAPQGQAVEQDIVPGLVIVLACGFARRRIRLLTPGGRCAGLPGPSGRGPGWCS